MLSKTVQDNRGQKSSSRGNGALISIKVFKVGSGPGILGCVLIFSKLAPIAGGTILFRLKLINAFLTGSTPVDYNPLSPNIYIYIFISFISTSLSSLNRSSVFLKGKSSSTIANDSKTSPLATPPFL